MKKSKFIVFGLLMSLCASMNVFAQSVEIPQSVISGFRMGDADLIGQYLSDNVDLVVLTTDNMYTKQQAKSILADFFRKNNVRDFQLAHKGLSKENVIFGVGNLSTSSGNYRVYFLMRKTTGNQSVIYSLRIENSND
jgi:hypothetical protein